MAVMDLEYYCKKHDATFKGFSFCFMCIMEDAEKNSKERKRMDKFRNESVGTMVMFSRDGEQDSAHLWKGYPFVSFIKSSKKAMWFNRDATKEIFHDKEFKGAFLFYNAQHDIFGVEPTNDLGHPDSLVLTVKEFLENHSQADAP